MENTNSMDAHGEDSVEFRICWSLGESFYLLKNNHNILVNDIKNGKMNTINESKKFYRNQLISIRSICGTLGFKDNKIEDFIEDLDNKIDNDFENETKPDFSGMLEAYLVGHLNGVDPRYNHIFRLSKHTQMLYEFGEIYLNLDIQKKALENLVIYLDSLTNLGARNKYLMFPIGNFDYLIKNKDHRKIYVEIDKLHSSLEDINHDIKRLDLSLNRLIEKKEIKKAIDIKNLETLKEFIQKDGKIDGYLEILSNISKNRNNKIIDKHQRSYLNSYLNKLKKDINRLKTILNDIDRNLEPSDKIFSKIYTDLENLKNYISRDKITLIHQTIHCWPTVSKNWGEYKTLKYPDVEVRSSYYTKFKPARFIDIINKIRGLITGSVEIYDILTKNDKIRYNLEVYGIIAIPLFIIAGLVWFHNYIPLLNQLKMPTSAIEINAYVTAIIAIIGAISSIKVIASLGKKYSDSRKLNLAINRLKNPI